MSVDPSTRPHSAAYFDEQRDFWWNHDYLRLVATRIGLERVRSVLDVGDAVGDRLRGGKRVKVDAVDRERRPASGLLGVLGQRRRLGGGGSPG